MRIFPRPITKFADDQVPVLKAVFDAIQLAINGHIGTDNLENDSVTAAKIAAGAVGTSELADSAVTSAKLGAQAVTSAKLKYFASTEQTGNGAEQSIAHGLGGTPVLVWVTITEASGAFDSGEGTHDGTNLKITVTSGVRYRVFAIAP